MRFDINKFDTVAYAARCEADLLTLGNAEKITKAVLLEMSRYVLEGLHTDEDIRPVNAIIRVLTPVNRKVAILYFKAFSGFGFNEDKLFTKKNDKTYGECRALSAEFLDDPLNNIWTWAARNVEVEAKPLDLNKLTKSVENFIKKGSSKKDVLRAVLAGGIDMETLVALMGDIADKEPAPVAAE